MGRQVVGGSSGALQVVALRRDGEQVPFAGHTLEFVDAAVVEFES